MGRDSAMAVVRASCMVTWPHSFRHARGAMRLFSASGSLILFPRLMVAMAERVTLNARALRRVSYRRSASLQTLDGLNLLPSVSTVVKLKITIFHRMRCRAERAGGSMQKKNGD